MVAQLLANGKVEHAFLGISAKAIQPDVARLFHLPVQNGLLVGAIEAGSGAAKAGLRASTNQVTVSGESWPLGGDVIVTVDGKPTSSISALRDAVASKRPGDTIKVGVLRSSRHLTLTIKLGRQPTTPR